jgi:hypothetical protein
MGFRLDDEILEFMAFFPDGRTDPRRRVGHPGKLAWNLIRVFTGSVRMGRAPDFCGIAPGSRRLRA